MFNYNFIERKIIQLFLNAAYNYYSFKIACKTFFIRYIYRTKKTKTKTIDFVCKINDDILFNNLFPNHKVQPSWDYFNDKKVIKIKIDQYDFNLNNPITFEDLFKITDDDDYMISLDLPFFKNLGDVYIYINYTINDKKYINIYQPGDTVKKSDFILNKTPFAKNFITGHIKYKHQNTDVIKYKYITDYIKCYLNCPTKITPELIFLNYDNLNLDLSKIKTVIVNKNGSISEFLINDELI